MQKLNILYQDDKIFIAQTLTGEFDKTGDDVYGDFNMGLHVGDDAGRVLTNRANFLSMLNQTTNGRIKRVSWLNQIHSDVVLSADEAFDIQPKDADALYCHETGVALAIMTADCVPVVLFDDKKVVACIHAGWQGLVSGIIGKTFAKMQVSQNKDIRVRAVIGACISQENYEITMELADKILSRVLDDGLTDLSKEALYQAIIKVQDDKDKCLIDIVKLTKLQLAKLGVQNLTEFVPCSYARPNLYSYRQQTHANKKATGRMATVVARLD